MRTKILLLAIALLTICPNASRADELRNQFRAVASTEATEVHPDAVFEVTVAKENITGTVQTIRIPDCGWDRVWRTSNRHATWDEWDCGYNDWVTVEIQPHESYVFPKPLKMYVAGSVKTPRVDFKLGFKMSTFGKTLWSAPLSVAVTP